MHTALDGMSSTYQPQSMHLGDLLLVAKHGTHGQLLCPPTWAAGNNHGDNFHNMVYNII